MNLNLYDENLNRIAIIGGQYVSCLWSEGYNTIENFALELIETDEYKKKIAVDCYVGRDDRKTLMVIKAVQISDGKIEQFFSIKNFLELKNKIRNVNKGNKRLLKLSRKSNTKEKEISK